MATQVIRTGAAGENGPRYTFTWHEWHFDRAGVDAMARDYRAALKRERQAVRMARKRRRGWA